MKYAVVLSALAAVAFAAKPSFLNSAFDVKEGEAFTLKFNNCQDGCTIILQNGPSTNTKDVKTLTTAAKGDSFTYTPGDIASGTYNFKIVSNTDASEFNYSVQFAYSGTGAAGTTANTSASSATASSASSHATASTSSAISSATSFATSAAPSTTTATTSMTSMTSSSSYTMTSVPGNNTTSSSTSSRPDVTPTLIPNAGSRACSPLALIAGAVAALAYLG